MTFKDVLKARRAELGMTQLDVAYALKITPSTVSSWERGVMVPHYKKLATLSKILKMNNRDLLSSLVEAEGNEESKNVPQN